MIELVNPKDARAVRNKNNILALYDLMINKKDAEQAVAKFFAPTPERNLLKTCPNKDAE